MEGAGLRLSKAAQTRRPRMQPSAPKPSELYPKVLKKLRAEGMILMVFGPKKTP